MAQPDTSRSFLTAVPKISKLYQHVIKKIAYKWEELAILLEFDDDGGKISSIRRDFIQQGVEICCFQALHFWIKGEGKKPVNWKTILTCLHDMQCPVIAQTIEKELSSKYEMGKITL